MPSAERDISRYLKRFLGRVTHDELPKAPDGTYAFLEQVAQKFHDPLFDMGVLVNPQGQVWAIISKEETCRETSGSCMDLFLVYGRGRGSWKKATHVTQLDRVVNIGVHNPENVPEGTPQPTIEGMLQELKDLVCTSSPPIN